MAPVGEIAHIGRGDAVAGELLQLVVVPHGRDDVGDVARREDGTLGDVYADVASAGGAAFFERELVPLFVCKLGGVL